MKCSFITFPSLSRNLKFSPFLNDIRRILLLIFHSKKWYVYSNMPDIHITFLCLRLHDHLKINEKFIIISLRSAYSISLAQVSETAVYILNIQIIAFASVCDHGYPRKPLQYGVAFINRSNLRLVLILYSS